MRTTAARPQTKQVMVCRDGRTLEPDFVVGGDVTGFAQNQVAVGTTLGGLAGSSALTFDGTTFAITGAATVSTTLGVTGDTTLGGNLLFSAATFLVAANTVDASDSSVLELCGGGAFSSARGAIIALYGNENANHGWLRMIAGDDSGNGTITLNTAGTTWFTLSRAGLITHTGALAVSGATTLTANTASTTTGTGTLVVTGGVGISGAIFAGDTITGTKDGSVGSLLGGLVARNATNTNKNIIIGVTTTDVYFVQANLNGTGSRPLSIQPGGGNVLVGTSTDDASHLLQIAGTTKVTDTTASTSTTTGCAVFAGGIGVANGAYFAGTFSSSGSTLFGTHDTSKAVGFSRFAAGDKYCYLNAGIDSANTSQASTGMVLAVRNSGNAQVLGLTVEETGSVVLGPKSALATNATDGFAYLPTSAGTPTGVPTAFTGKVAFQYDTTNNKFYVYNGGWKATAALT